MAKKVNREETLYQVQENRRQFIEANKVVLSVSSLVKIVGYSLSKFQDLEHVLNTVKKTIKDRKLSNLVVHSDQGFQFTHKSYIELLESKGIKVSHSRRGKCLDNAPIECFFGHLKSELPHLYILKTDEEILNAVQSYIKFYNEERIQIKLKGCSPNEFGETA